MATIFLNMCVLSQRMGSMNDTAAKELCLALIHAESEEEVVETLRAADMWEDESLWRYYGDDDGNYSTVGNQQSRPDAALIEKLVNSIDARLILECRLAGLDPSTTEGPRTLRAAVAQFIDKADPSINHVAGLVSEWDSKKRTDVARGITLAATGNKASSGYPNLTICDAGEGQTPDDVPETFMSLHRTNKINIQFVQGKFNMGGTGVLQFCGKQNLQLIVTRRCPDLLDDHAVGDDHKWSFSVVRRELPTGSRRSSVYTYLAPLAAETHPRKGQVMRFAAGSLPLFPDGQQAYLRETVWGSLIKLYEYEITERGHMFLTSGLLERLDLLLPGAALPIRLHECRDYKGHAGSFETTMSGLTVRLEDNKGENLEPGFPSSAPLRAGGVTMDATLYAFKPNAAERYRKTEGIIFTVNGQTHGHFTLDFFRRKRAGRQDYLARSLLLLVNCDRIAGGAREDLFMNSRDRLRGGELRGLIERALEGLLSEHHGLKELRERRRREEIESKLQDEKPLQEVLESILRHSPTLSALFQTGRRITSPFKTKQVSEQESEYIGKRYPTYFKFAGLSYGQVLERTAHLNRRLRIRFETDAANDYFARSVDSGSFELWVKHPDSSAAPVEDFVLNLHNGSATLNFNLPAPAAVGSQLRYTSVVSDPTQIEEFENAFVLSIAPPAESVGGNGKRRKPPSPNKGKDRESSAALALPTILPVYEAEWTQQDPVFDQYTALRIKRSVEGEQDGDATEVFDFYINMDNAYFKHELKYSKGNDDLLTAQWKYGLVLIGLGLLQEEKQHGSRPGEADEEADTLPDAVDRMSRAVAPVLLPMIDYLGDLDLETAVAEMAVGEAT